MNQVLAKIYRLFQRSRFLDERGFTMPELLLVAGILFVLTAGTFLLLRPAVHTAEDLQAERRLEIASLAQALKRYKAVVGQLPNDLPAEPMIIGFGDGSYDLCNILVPTYIKDIPLDPQIGVKYLNNVQQTESGPACIEEGVMYVSGYTIVKAPGGGATLAAPTEGKDTITMTVR